MTVYFPEHVDSPAADYTIGSILIVMFLASSALNPLSFFYHIQRDSKLSSRLYALLALFDFIINIYSPLFNAHNFLREREDVSRDANVHAKAVQASANIAAWASHVLVNIITCVRCYKIRFPFKSVNEKLVWICVSCFVSIFVCSLLRNLIHPAAYLF